MQTSEAKPNVPRAESRVFTIMRGAMSSRKTLAHLTARVCKLHKLNYGGLRNFCVSRSASSPIIGTSIDVHAETVKVLFHNHVEREYPWLFLQDNCTCEECFHQSSKSRKRLMTNLCLEKRVAEVSLVGTDKIKCVWSDGHAGEFSEKWLEDRCFSTENINRRKTFLRDKLKFTPSHDDIHRTDFKEVLEDPFKMLHLLKALCTRGVAFAENAPKETGQLKKLVDKIGFIRTTHYGNEFTVKSESNASNLAYTSTPLCVHTDLPYYVYPPGVQLLHCIQQYKGDDGAYTHLVDGFFVADKMKRQYPESYKILSEVSVEFADVGQDFTKFDKIHHSPTFVHSNKGQLIRIVYSNQQLSSVQPIPLKEVKPLYSALKLFTTLCYNPDSLMRFKLKEGDVLIFDNWRMLHGREGFEPSKGGRHLEGCYIDFDEVYSTIRVLGNGSE